MKKCPNCQNEVALSEDICPFCGEKLVAEMADAQNESYENTPSEPSETVVTDTIETKELETSEPVTDEMIGTDSAVVGEEVVASTVLEDNTVDEGVKTTEQINALQETHEENAMSFSQYLMKYLKKPEAQVSEGELKHTKMFAIIACVILFISLSVIVQKAATLLLGLVASVYGYGYNVSLANLPYFDMTNIIFQVTFRFAIGLALLVLISYGILKLAKAQLTLKQYTVRLVNGSVLPILLLVIGVLLLLMNVAGLGIFFVAVASISFSLVQSVIFLTREYYKQSRLDRFYAILLLMAIQAIIVTIMK